MSKNNEATLNDTLARILQTKNPHWTKNNHLTSEQTDVLVDKGRKPDIVVHNQDGSILILETEYEPALSVEKDARQRLGSMMQRSNRRIEHTIALKAPAYLKEVVQTRIEEAVNHAQYEYCLFSVDNPNKPPTRWPTNGWIQGTLNHLADLIESAALSEYVVAESAQILEDGVSKAATLLRSLLYTRPAVNRKIVEYLHQEDSAQTSNMAMTIIANAFTFQAILSGTYDIKTFDELKNTKQAFKRNVLAEWERILTEINYWPIFDIARNILLPIPETISYSILDTLAGTASRLSEKGVTRSHDLSGKMFQRLITDRKFLATFYTLPESATLLAELAIPLLDVDWSKESEVTDLQIADLACGTGTLISAAYQAILQRYRRSGKDDASIHKDMIEHALMAVDIMPAATHLTISMLSSIHPTITFEDTQVCTMPYGTPHETGQEISIGSLDLIQESYKMSLFSTGAKVQRGKEAERTLSHADAISRKLILHRDSLDWIIMNPPFTRPTNHEGKKSNIPIPSFAGFRTSEAEQQEMSKKLSKIRRHLREPAGNGYAGLASNFLDLGHVNLGVGGILSLVMPLSLLQGEAWQASRNLLEKHYENILCVTIAAEKAHHQSFSADTGMGEVLIVAKKKPPSHANTNSTDTNSANTNYATVNNPKCVTFINLYRRPVSRMEAQEFAKQIHIRTSKQEQPGILSVGTEIVGTTFRESLSKGGCASVRDFSLVETVQSLESGYLKLLQTKEVFPIPVTKLQELGERGLVDREIGYKPTKNKRTLMGPFWIVEVTGVHVEYPVLWGHDIKSSRENRLVVSADSEGKVRENMEARAVEVWNTATYLHFSRNFRLNSQSLAACMTPERTLGGAAWPNFQMKTQKHDFAMVLWANTTLGLLLFWWHGSRPYAGRIQITVTRLPLLNVLDTRVITTAQHQKAEGLFKKFSNKKLLPANEAYHDPVRQELDKSVLVELLGLPEDILIPLSLLRQKWCAEPTVHGGKSTQFPPTSNTSKTSKYPITP